MAEQLVINGVNLTVEDAWEVMSLTELHGQGDYRGSDFVAAGTAGQTARTWVLDAWRFPLVVEVYGIKLGQTGAAPSSTRQGVIDNIAYLKSQLFPPYSGGAKLVTATYTHPDAGTETAQVRCVNPQVVLVDTPIGNIERLTFDVIVPAGKFT